MKHVQSISSRACAVALASTMCAFACGSDQPAKDPTSYGQQYSAELQQERQEFINETEQRLDEVENRIGQLQARLQHERRFVPESQEADWSQELFELQLEQQRARARLERARTSDLEAWEAMRGDLANNVDRLEAALDTVGANIASVFDGDDEQPTQDQSERQPVGGQDDPELDTESNTAPSETP